MSPVSQTLPQPKTATYSLAGTLAWFVVVGFSFVFLLAILAGPHFFGHHLKAGDIAEQDLVAPSKTMVVDDEKTQENRDIARHDVLPVLKRDWHKSKAIMQRIQGELERLKHLLSDGVLPMPQSPQMSTAEQVYLMELPEKDYERFVSSVNSAGGTCPLSGSTAVSVFNKLHSLPATVEKTKAHGGKSGGKVEQSALSKGDYIAQLSSNRIKCQTINSPPSKAQHKLLLLAAAMKPDEAPTFVADTSAAVQRLLDNVSLQPYVDRHEWESQMFEFLPDKIEPGVRHLCASFLADELDTNVSVDPAATEGKLKEAVAAVKPVMKEIDVGSIIVHKGDTITAEEVQTLESLGITTVSDPGLAAAITIALFAAFLLFGLYLHTYEPKLFFSPSALALMATLSIITSLIALFIGPQYPQFVPLSAATLIFAVTYGRRLTGILTVLILLFLSVSDLMTGPHLVAIGTAAGMALGASVKRRRDLMVTGILVGCMQMLGYSSAVLIGGTPAQTAGLGTALPMEMLGGLFSAISAIGSLPFLENIFGILTPYRIAELAEPDQPLMRQLEENAPGTYQHSLAVANLAEGGARAIGANVNLVHTGAMYHDIGKMVTPRYFIENQLGDKNPHDFIPPEESRAKVLAHVTNGLALAQKYGLPKAVQAFIPEHQGTTVMAYFYHKACLRDGSENVDPLFYRYPGPKPQTRESAIVMLADVSEAVTHSMREPTMEEVDTAISSVFKARWEDGQFSESGLTHEELEKVKRGFVRVWRTLHHDRLKYPSTTTGKMPVVPPASQNVAAENPKPDAVKTETIKTESTKMESAEPNQDSGCC